MGLIAPAGTPQPVIARMHDEVVAVLATAAIREKLAAQLMENGRQHAGRVPQAHRRGPCAVDPGGPRRQHQDQLGLDGIRLECWLRG